jgi:O-antigen ligase
MYKYFKNFITLIFLLIPVVFIPGNTFIEADKAIVFRIAVSISLIVFTFYFLNKNKIFIPKLDSILLIAVTGLTFSSLFSVFASASSHVSFWGSMQRPLSFFTLMFCVILVFLTVSSFEENDFNKTIKTILFGSGLVSVYAVFQFIGLDIFGLSSDLFSGRASSFIGHPSFLGQYMLLAVFLTIKAFQSSLVNNKILYGLITFQILALLLSGNRSSLLGLIIGGFIYLILNKKYRIKTLASMCVLLVSITVLQFLPFKQAPIVNRLYVSTSNLQTIETRLEIWRNTFKLIKNKPLLGHGPELFAFTFAPYINAELISNESLNSRPDRAHNFIIQTIHDYGFIGLLFLSMIIYWMLRNSYMNKEHVIISMLLAYMVSLFFSFQSLPDALILMFVFAYLLSRERSQVLYKNNAMVTIIIVTFSLIAILISGSQFLANINFAKGNFENASKYGYMFHDLKQYQSFYAKDDTLLLKVIQQNSLNNDAWYLKGLIAYEVKDYNNANIFVINSLKLFPNDIKSLELYARLKFDTGDFNGSIATFQKLISLTPDYWSKDIDKEEYQLKKRIFLKENPDFFVNFIYLARAYFEINEIENAFKYLDYAKDGYDKFYTFAVIYDRLGQEGLSKEYLEKSFLFQN